MAIIHTVQQPAQFQYMIFCPGCKCGHGLRVGQSDGPNWKFNGSMERPTFEPSLLIQGRDFTAKGRAEYEAWAAAGYPRPDGLPKKFESMDTVCHSFILDGKIQFLSDCTHELRGRTVTLEDFWAIR
jgi:hypothetical protein